MAAARARTRGADRDTGKPTPRSDAYTGLLIISLLAQMAGAVFLYLDYKEYPETPPQAVQRTPPGGGGAPVTPPGGGVRPPGGPGMPPGGPGVPPGGVRPPGAPGMPPGAPPAVPPGRPMPPRG